MNGLLGGMFGQAKAGTEHAQQVSPSDQASQTMATAEMTVQAANVTINGAKGLINGLQTQAGLTGESAPATALSNVPASAASAVGNAPSAAAAAALSAVPKLTGTIGNGVVCKIACNNDPLRGGFRVQSRPPSDVVCQRPSLWPGSAGKG